MLSIFIYEKPYHNLMQPIYPLAEDSFLLQKYVEQYAAGKVLDVGTGSGIQALTAARQAAVKRVIAADINPAAITHCRNEVRHKKISYKLSDLFSALPRSAHFDTIIFNPPYLPEDRRLKDIALDGGKRGYELLERFLREAPDHLSPAGRILIVFSSLTDKKTVDRIISEQLLTAELLETVSLDFERLYCYIIHKSAILRELEKRGVLGLRHFTKGHRGAIFKGSLGSLRREIAVKIQRADSPSPGTIDHESAMLVRLNKKKVGPKLLLSMKGCFVYEFINGEFIEDFLKRCSRAEAIDMFNGVLLQCRAMDLSGINKEEMHHPFKHVLISRSKKKLSIHLLDFERAIFSQKPHNVTQFCQYLTGGKISGILRDKPQALVIDCQAVRKLAALYKHDQSEARFNAIMRQVSE